MHVGTELDRRGFLRSTLMATSTVLLAGAPLAGWAEEKKSGKGKGVKEVSPVEDLMREHGALNRILLIYDETARRIRSKEEMDPDLLKQSAKLIHDFIEGYHEKLEEEFLFPRLKKAHRLVNTVDTLLAQHQAGRKLTQTIITLSTTTNFRNAPEQLLSALSAFNRMYRPHEAREDTVVFPEFKKVVTAKEYDKLGDRFEDREHQLFGKEGFEGVVAKIARIEEALGIHDLSLFTPKV